MSIKIASRIYCLFRAPRTEKSDEEAELDTSDAKAAWLDSSANLRHFAALVRCMLLRN